MIDSLPGSHTQTGVLAVIGQKDQDQQQSIQPPSSTKTTITYYYPITIGLCFFYLPNEKEIINWIIMNSSLLLRVFAVALLSFITICSKAVALDEYERIEEHDKRYSRQWPPPKYIPDTVGWKRLMDARFRQVAEIDDLGRRYEGYMQVNQVGF